MKRKLLGNSDIEIPAIGVGCNRLLDPADEVAVAAVDAALERGVNFFDSADMYGWGEGEKFLSVVLAGRRDQAIVASKFGMVREADGIRFRASPEYVRQACDASLQRLGMDVIDLYYQHRIDADVPVEETHGAMAELVAQGKVRATGISNASPDEIRRAHATHPLSAAQLEYSLFVRAPEAEILPVCAELGITFVAYGPLAFAFLGGEIETKDDFPAGDNYRRGMPRVQDENIGHNRELLAAVREVAEETGATLGQVSLAWLITGSDHVVPIPGSRQTKHLMENADAVDLTLTPAQMDHLNAVFHPGAVKGGTR